MYKAKHVIYTQNAAVNLASGEYYSIILVLRGTGLLQWEDKRAICGTQELILIKPAHSAKLEYVANKIPLEILWVQCTEQLLQALSVAKVDLRAAFNVVPFSCACIPTSNEVNMLLKNLALRLATPEPEPDFGDEVFCEGLLKMFIVLVLRAGKSAELDQRIKPSHSFLLDDLFVYIHAHISEEISLDTLASEFYVSKYHIAREFKRQTGQSVHAYIVRSKLELCKRFIANGLPITEVYRRGGFGGYNHFFRAFRKEYGMTPKAYYRSTQNSSDKKYTHTE